MDTLNGKKRIRRKPDNFPRDERLRKYLEEG